MDQATGLYLFDLYLAGEIVSSGRYRDVDTRREVVLKEDGPLPASLDGRIAAYVCVEHTWVQHRSREEAVSV